MARATIQVRSKGTITLPQSLREKYSVAEGDVYSVVDLGRGALLLSPHASKMAALLDDVARIVVDQGVSLDTLLQALDEEREAYYHERYLEARPIPR
ncbi:MAG: hypothetical protein HW416_1697 [Chloroflexi bacterium]|nr:hypothetical protein [Chloroflexota bacterium]